MNILVTGCNRGIGLELTRQLLSAGHKLISTARDTSASEELQSLKSQYGKSLNLFDLDIAREEYVSKIQEYLNGKSLCALVNNAGVLKEPRVFFDEDAMNSSWQTNVIGTTRIIEAALPALRSGKARKIINISTIMSSLAYAGADNMPYRVSKTALNMVTRMYANKLAGEQFTVLAVHPGWVKTDMGGAAAPLSVKESAEALLHVIEDTSPEDNGRFMDAINPGKDITF